MYAVKYFTQGPKMASILLVRVKYYFTEYFTALPGATRGVLYCFTEYFTGILLSKGSTLLLYPPFIGGKAVKYPAPVE